MRWAVVVSCAGALAGCAGAPTAHMIPDVERPAVHVVLAMPVMFGPVAKPATSWNQVIDAPPSTPARDQIFGALRAEAAGKGDPVRDPRLDLVAGDFADLIARGGEIDHGVEDFALGSRGVPESMYSLLVSTATTPEAAVAEITPKLEVALHFGNVHVGVGGGDGKPFVVAIIHTSLVTLPPTVPRVLPAKGEITFRAPVDSSLHAPRVTVAFDDDRDHPQTPKLTPVDRVTFETTLSCGDHTGAMWVSVEACDDKNAVQRLLLFPIACATPLDVSYRVEPRKNIAAADLATRLSAIINRDREEAHQNALQGDLRADLAAHDATELMKKTGRVAHEWATSTTLGRLRDEGLLATITLEATMHAKDLAAASEILLNNRGYKEMILKPEPTHIGINVLPDGQGEYFIAVELVQIIEPIRLDRVEEDMMRRIDARRSDYDRKHAPLRRDKFLDRFALKYAYARARGWRDEVAMDAIQHDVNFRYGPYKNTWRAITLLLDDDPSKVDIGPERAFHGIGIAAVQAPRNGALAGRTFVIVLYGTYR
ncbi:MAG: hypothetical protein QM831_24610 [Kofleriaceae bacterium]